MSPAVSCVHHAPCAHRDSRRPALMHTPAAVVVLRPPRAPPTVLPQSCKRHTRPAHSVHQTSHAHTMDKARPCSVVARAVGGSCCWRRRRRQLLAATAAAVLGGLLPKGSFWPGGIAGGHDARPSAIGLIGGRGGRSSERMTCGMGRSACAHGTAAMLAREPGSVQCCAAGRKLQAAARDRASRRLARRRVAVDVSHLPISKLVQSSPPN